jgi:RHS repeat-associated protein
MLRTATTKVSAAVLIALTLITASIALAYADDGLGAESEQTAVDAPPSAPGGPELENKRTATSQTYLLPGGERETRIYAAPINYRDDDGNWQPIDEGLERAAGGPLVNGDNSFDLKLPAHLGAGSIRLTAGDQWVSQRLLGQETDAAQLQPDGAAATYEGGDGGTAFEFSAIPNGIKEEIEVPGPSAPSTFTYELQASPGLTPSLVKDGSVDFKGRNGASAMTLPAPTIADNDGVVAPEGVQFLLESAGDSRWLLKVEVDREWLLKPERKWPVRIDPTLELHSPSLDCQFSLFAVIGYSATECAAPTSEPGPLFKPCEGWCYDKTQRVALRFDLASLPAGSYVSEATVGINSPEPALNTTGLELRNILPEDPWNNYVSWFYYDAAASHWREWNGNLGKYVDVSGGAYSSSSGAQVLTSTRGSQAGWWTFSSPSMASSAEWWASNPSKNQGFLLKLLDDTNKVCSSGVCTQRSVAMNFSGSPDANVRPYMNVKWYGAAPASSKMVTPMDGTRTARRFKLKSSWASAGVTGVTYQYGVGGGWETIPPSLVKAEQGQAVSWPMPVEGKSAAPVYFDIASAPGYKSGLATAATVRALFEGPSGVAGYSKPVSAVVDRKLGNARDAKMDVGPGSLDLATGNLTITTTDVSIPTPNGPLEFGRSDSARAWGPGEESVMGWGWTPSTPVSIAGGSMWRSIQEFEPEEEMAYALLTSIDGLEIPFEKTGSTYAAPPELNGWELSRVDATHLRLGEPSGTLVVFEKEASGAKYIPATVSTPGGPNNKTQFVYQLANGAKRLTTIIAPSAPGQSPPCTESNATTTLGCRSLTFTYQPATTWGAPVSYKDRLAKITYFGPLGGGVGQWDVAQYCYNANGQMTSEWDPRLATGASCAALPVMRVNYSYVEKWGPLQTIKPRGEEAWTMQYVPPKESEFGLNFDSRRLISVSRPTLLAKPNDIAKTTIAYEVPLSGSSAPYGMSPTAVAECGQKDIPTDATAVFPPDEVPSSPPSAYTRATVYYMDAEGQLVNTATPKGAGTAAASVVTTERDEFGNVIRELSAQNRLRALAQSTEAGKVAKAEQLTYKRAFSADGLEMQEEWGPLHSVRMSSGAIKQARLHRIVEYDALAPIPPAGTPKAHFPTRITTGASIAGEGADADQRVTETKYNWTLRKPEEVIVDPLGLNLHTRTAYDASSGLSTELSLPANPSGGDAHTAKTIYYSAQAQSSDPQCQNSPGYANLPCKVLPAAQPGTAGQPQILVKRVAAYSPFGAPTEVVESPGGSTEGTRKTLATYDDAGRPLTVKQEGGGTPVPKSESLYSESTGRPTVKRFKCEEANCTGFDTQALTTTYDTLGRITSYEDADGSKSTTTYDLLGRPVTTSDGKGTQTRAYDPITGLQTELQDSAAGKFTAAYDADGQITEQGFPNGLRATTTYDETGAPTHLSYVKTTMCSSGCTWLDFSSEESIYGQVLSQTSTLSSQQYSYDKAGRLKQTLDTLQGGPCATRSYSFDKDSNRTALITRAPGLGGACDTTSAGTTQSYSYDAADRLLGTGLTYDNFGRITSLPAAYADGKALSTEYFSNDMVAMQSQNGVTNTFQLDASGRQRQRLQGGGGLEGTEVFHYANGSDSPAWTVRGSAWTRSIPGIGGELASIQTANGTTLRLTNLHGDVVANTSLNPEATKLSATYEYDEFGVPKGEGPSRYGWLGGKGRRTELASGVIQMGARSYVPQIGRFLTPDPVPGGSANAYDYANQDPVNMFDLDGTCMQVHKGGRWLCAGAGISKSISHANANTHRVLPITIRCSCVSKTTVLEQAESAVSRWTAPVRHWTAERAQEVGSAVSGAAASIPCRTIGLALSGAGVMTSSVGLATVWIPGVGETLLLVGASTDLTGLAFDLSHEKGLC